MYDVEAQSRGTTNLFTSLFESKQESEGKMLDSWSVMLKHNKQWHQFLTVTDQFMFVSQATSILLKTEQWETGNEWGNTDICDVTAM